MRMTDVLVSYDFPPMIGGAHSWLYEIYRRWPTDVDVLTAKYSKSENEASRQRSFDSTAHGALRIARTADTTHQIDLRSYHYLRSLWRQASEIGRLAGNRRSSGPEVGVIHALRAFPEGVAAWLCWRRNRRTRRLVTYVHGEEILVSQTSRQLTMLANRVYQDSDLIIANSENTRRILAETYSGVESVSIHPGVDVKRFSQVGDIREGYRKARGWPSETVVVLTLARMEPRKNHAMVIRAVTGLRAEGIPVALICGGDGPERKALEKLASDLRVAPWVHFVGSIGEEEKPTLFSSADIFAMPSVSVGAMIEGFGIVFLEAAAAGLPTVCGNSGGQCEAVLSGKSGFAVDGKSLEAVAHAIKRLATNSNLRRTFGDAGRKWAADNDWEILGEKVQSAVRQVAGARALNNRTTQR
jgi:phosphatidylinositol alpha-1,6-mannosyltransferase